MKWLALSGGLAALLLAAAWVVRMLDWALWRPRRMAQSLRAQGLNGSTYRPLSGDLKDMAKLAEEARAKPMPAFSHDIFPRVMPLFQRFIETYGERSADDFDSPVSVRLKLKVLMSDLMQGMTTR